MRSESTWKLSIEIVDGKVESYAGKKIINTCELKLNQADENILREILLDREKKLLLRKIFCQVLLTGELLQSGRVVDAACRFDIPDDDLL